jgi:hypothetical protein
MKADRRGSPAKRNWTSGLIGRPVRRGGVFSGNVNRTASAHPPAAMATSTMKAATPMRSENAAASAGPMVEPSPNAAVSAASDWVRSAGLVRSAT